MINFFHVYCIIIIDKSISTIIINSSSVNISMIIINATCKWVTVFPSKKYKKFTLILLDGKKFSFFSF